MDEAARYNIERWRALNEANALFTRPALELDAAAARQRVDPAGRLGDLGGKPVLCLAGGGGQQSAAFALLGARVTVVDLSEAQLQRDREAAAHYGVQIDTVQGDMRDLSHFADATFDVVWQPYALNFVPDARGHGSSGGYVSLDGPREVADVRTEFRWFAGLPEVSDTQIGAWGISLGGGAAWNSIVAGVPFRALETFETWSDLYQGLFPQNFGKSGAIYAFAPAARVGLRVVPDDLPGLIAAGRAVKQALEDSLRRLGTAGRPPAGADDSVARIAIRYDPPRPVSRGRRPESQATRGSHHRVWPTRRVAGRDRLQAGRHLPAERWPMTSLRPHGIALPAAVIGAWLASFAVPDVAIAQCIYSALTSGVSITTGTTDADLQFSESLPYWSVLGVRPNASNADWDAYVYSGTIAYPFCLNGLLASSTLGAASGWSRACATAARA